MAIVEQTTLPFGRYANQPLAGVPLDYLRWLVGECKLGPSLRATVTAELTRRGASVPPPPPPTPPPDCPRCGPGAGIVYTWMQLRTGAKRIRRTCQRCGGPLGFAPHVEPFTTLADRAASPTALLDVLVQAADLGIPLKSDGTVADFARYEDRRRAPVGLQQRLRQCRHSLGAMMGKTYTPEAITP